MTYVRKNPNHGQYAKAARARVREIPLNTPFGRKELGDVLGYQNMQTALQGMLARSEVIRVSRGVFVRVKEIKEIDGPGGFCSPHFRKTLRVEKTPPAVAGTPEGDAPSGRGNPPSPSEP